MLVEQRGDLGERLQVLDDHLPHVGPLHLDRHLPPVAQGGAVHLAERAGGHRHRVELREGLGEPDAELGRTMASTSSKGNGSTLSCRRASASRGRRQQVGAGQELAELDEGGPQRLEVGGELARPPRRCRRAAAPRRATAPPRDPPASPAQCVHTSRTATRSLYRFKFSGRRERTHRYG